MISDLRVSSLQCGLPSPTDRSLAPASFRLLLLRSSSLRLEDWELRTVARASQLFSVKLHTLRLQRKKGSVQLEKYNHYLKKG